MTQAISRQNYKENILFAIDHIKRQTKENGSFKDFELVESLRRSFKDTLSIVGNRERAIIAGKRTNFPLPSYAAVFRYVTMEYSVTSHSGRKQR